MRSSLKKILYSLPRSVRTKVVIVREWLWEIIMKNWENQNYHNLPLSLHNKQPIKNILIYSIHGLGFGGTEKCLQVIANALASEYNVYLMYGNKTATEERKQTMNTKITFIPFSYEENQVAVPHRVTKMNPHIKNVLQEHSIDLIVTASPGYSHYPWNIIKGIPIILVNIFGAPTLQKNVRKLISISRTVQIHAEEWTGQVPNRNITMFAPLAKLPPTNTLELRNNLRVKLGIEESDFIFGRIGRNDNNIFDPIGIRAWQKISPDYPNTHYLIMSPAPALVQIVEEENIPRVHFLPPSGKEEDVWAFHSAIDAMAHFRRDGETSGVAIAESLILGKPILTHRSSIWNAHLEYLDESCALIAGFDNIEEYSGNMRTFIEIRQNNPDKWLEMQKSAKQIGEEHFSPVRYSDKIRKIVANI